MKYFTWVTKENERIVKDEPNDSKSENIILKKKVDLVTHDLAKFTQRKKNLDILLRSQRCCFNKSGLGYNLIGDQKLYVDTIVKSSTCNFCEKIGHISHTCPIREKFTNRIKFVWIPKDKVKEIFSNTNILKKIMN